MSFDYTKIRLTSDRLLEKFGQVVSITHVVPGVYDPATGLVTNTTTIQNGTGAVIEWDARQIDNSLILATDKRLLLSALNASSGALTPPVLGDTVTDASGIVYTLVAPLKAVNPAGIVVLYDINLRGGA